MANRTRIRIWHPNAVDLVEPGARKPERKMAMAPIDIDVRTFSAADGTSPRNFALPLGIGKFGAIRPGHG